MEGLIMNCCTSKSSAWCFLRLLSVYLGTSVLFVPMNASAQSLGPKSASLSAVEISRLRREADAWLASTDDIALRKASGELYPLIDALLSKGEDDNVVRYLARILKADPCAYEYQLTYGEILARMGQPEILQAKALQAMQRAEDDDTIRRAYRLAGQTPPPPPASLEKSSQGSPELILVRLGNVSDFWMFDLRDALSRKLGIKVSVAQFQFSAGPADRTGLQQFIEASRRRLLKSAGTDDGLFEFLSAHGLTRSVLETNDDEVLHALRLIINESEGEAAAQKLDTRIESLRHTGMQWDADKMLFRVEGSVVDFNRPHRWILAVTDLDIYSDKNNYQFGVGDINGPVGLISAARFSAKFNEENPKRERLTTRLLKQALSTFGFMIDVPRCSTPDCARAYPSSLQEHDEKSDQLCAECEAAFKKALGQEKR